MNKDFSPEEVKILETYQSQGFAVGHIDKHRNLWNWASERGIGVYIGRRANPTISNKNAPNKWANQFKIHGRWGRGDGSRKEVIDLYSNYLEENEALKLDARRELRNKILFCHCYPAKCHGDELNEIANEK